MFATWQVFTVVFFCLATSAVTPRLISGGTAFMLLSGSIMLAAAPVLLSDLGPEYASLRPLVHTAGPIVSGLGLIVYTASGGTGAILDALRDFAGRRSSGAQS